MPLQQSRVRHADDIHKNIKPTKKKRTKYSWDRSNWRKCADLKDGHLGAPAIKSGMPTHQLRICMHWRWLGACSWRTADVSDVVRVPIWNFCHKYPSQSSSWANVPHFSCIWTVEWVKAFHITNGQLCRMTSSDPHNIWSVICTSTLQETKIDMKSNSRGKITNCLLKGPFACFTIEFTGEWFHEWSEKWRT